MTSFGDSSFPDASSASARNLNKERRWQRETAMERATEGKQVEGWGGMSWLMCFLVVMQLSCEELRNWVGTISDSLNTEGSSEEPLPVFWRECYKKEKSQQDYVFKKLHCSVSWPELLQRAKWGWKSTNSCFKSIHSVPSLDRQLQSPLPWGTAPPLIVKT